MGTYFYLDTDDDKDDEEVSAPLARTPARLCAYIRSALQVAHRIEKRKGKKPERVEAPPKKDKKKAPAAGGKGDGDGDGDGEAAAAGDDGAAEDAGADLDLDM
jgi:hypothetical protein